MEQPGSEFLGHWTPNALTECVNCCRSGSAWYPFLGWARHLVNEGENVIFNRHICSLVSPVASSSVVLTG